MLINDKPYFTNNDDIILRKIGINPTLEFLEQGDQFKVKLPALEVKYDTIDIKF